MKIAILAAGKGTRMLPLTEHTQKVLIPINGKPFLDYIVHSLFDSGFSEKDIGIIAGYKSEQIVDFVKKNYPKITVMLQKEQKGTGDAVMSAYDFVHNSNFMIISGDNIYSVDDISAIKKNDSLSYICGIYSTTPEKYGVLLEKGGKLIEIKEKPKQFFGNLVNTGLYKFTPEIFDALQKTKQSERGEYELTDAISMLAKEGKVNVSRINKYWIDLGCIEDIPRVEKQLKELGISK